jgi:hypothetical protein
MTRSQTRPGIGEGGFETGSWDFAAVILCFTWFAAYAATI